MSVARQSKKRRSPGETREELVQATVRLILRQGFSATRVDEICAEAGLTKGAFFHHFGSKEEIGEAAIAWWGRMGAAVYAPAWNEDGRDPLERLRQMLDLMSGFSERPNDPCVCVVGMMSQEFAQSNPTFRSACDRELTHWTEQVAKLLEAARATHQAVVDFDSVTVAWFLNSLWQGSMLVSKTRGDAALIRSNLQIARRYVDSLFAN